MNTIVNTKTQSNINNNRDSAIELLRILAIMGVILLHYNNWDIGGGLQYVVKGSFNEYYLKVVESLFIPSVNLFIIISAYFLSKTEKRNIAKVILLVFEYIFFKVLMYLTNVGLGFDKFDIGTFFLKFIPTAYFVVLYVILYLISPYINRLTGTLNRKQFKRFLIIMFSIFSIYGFIVDIVCVYTNIASSSPIGMLGSQGGYTIINFALAYIFGSYIQKYNINLKKRNCCLIYLGCSLLIFGLSCWNLVAWNYNNPIVFISAVSVLLFFKQLKFKNIVINELAKCCFTCYLIHSFFYRFIHIEKYVNSNFFIVFGHQLATVLSLFIISYLIYKLYYCVFGWAFKIINNKMSTLNIYNFNNKNINK